MKSPDVRGWGIIAGVYISTGIFVMIGIHPAFTQDSAFMTFASSIITGTLLTVYNYLFGGTKAGTENAAKMADTVAATASVVPVAPVVAPIPATVPTVDPTPAAAVPDAPAPTVPASAPGITS